LYSVLLLVGVGLVNWPAVDVLAVRRVEVVDRGDDGLILVACFQRMAAEDLRVIHFGVIDQWILPLGAGVSRGRRTGSR